MGIRGRSVRALAQVTSRPLGQVDSASGLAIAHGGDDMTTTELAIDQSKLESFLRTFIGDYGGAVTGRVTGLRRADPWRTQTQWARWRTARSAWAWCR